jgi:hypothetical protein
MVSGSGVVWGICRVNMLGGVRINSALSMATFHVLDQERIVKQCHS